MVSISDHFDLDINTVQALVHLSLCCLLHIYQECRQETFWCVALVLSFI